VVVVVEVVVVVAVAVPHQGTSGQMTGWKIHRPDSALPSPAYCFASVIENKNVTISDRFICFILTVKRHCSLCFEGNN